MKIALWLTLAGLLYGSVVALAYLFQRQLQYQPGHADPEPERLGLVGVSRVSLMAADGVALVLWYARAAAGQPTILFLHGNAGDLTDRTKRMAFYQSVGFGAVFLSYRGFGGSGGQISEAGLLLDARAAYEWLRVKGVSPAQIMLVGESLGTGVAVQLAASVPVAAVALDAPYSSTLAVAQGRFPFLPLRWLMRDQFRSTDHIAHLHAPVLIQHGTTDRVVPFRLGQDLFAAAVEPKTFVALPGLGHDMIFSPDVWRREVDFFGQIAGR